MIKVLQILSDTNIGGAGRLLVNYLKNFDRDRFDVRVVLPKNSELKPYIEAVGYEVNETEHGRDKSFDLRAVGETVRIIKEFSPDIVHTHSAFSGKLAAFLAGTPSRFYTRHSAFPQPKKLTTFPGKQLSGFVNNTLATDIVAVAEAAKDNLTETGVDERKITVIVNGVEEVRRTSEKEKKELREALGIKDGMFVAGISARLEPYKGHSYLIESAKEVVQCHPEARFLIIGSGSTEDELKKQAEALGVSENVIFTGFVTDVAPYYNIMDLSLNCSWGTEATSLALAEGMSLAVPTVATSYGGNPYMIDDGVNGYLVPEKDSHAMAEKITALIEDRDHLAELSAGARRIYEERFTAAKMAEKLEALYEASVAAHGKKK